MKSLLFNSARYLLISITSIITSAVFTLLSLIELYLWKCIGKNKNTFPMHV
jgi:hypothetical protein